MTTSTERKINKTDSLPEVVTKGGSEVETYAFYPRFFNVVLEYRDGNGRGTSAGKKIPARWLC